MFCPSSLTQSCLSDKVVFQTKLSFSDTKLSFYDTKLSPFPNRRLL
ncbi:unnamed protein product [Arabidopsis halleri]